MSDDLISPPHSGISPEDWQHTPASVCAWITVWGVEIKQIKETVEKLQEIVKRNSQNSSQPPHKTARSTSRSRKRLASCASAGVLSAEQTPGSAVAEGMVWD